MPRLIAALVRHGDYQQLADTPSAHQPFALTAAGEQQARECGKALAAEAQAQTWQLQAQIDCSRLLRAWQTAQGIAAELPLQCQVQSFEELAERGVGSAANLSVSQIEQVIAMDPRCEPLPPNWKSDSYFCLPLQGAESLEQAGVRVATHVRLQMQMLREQATADCLKIFVGHGAALRHAAWKLGVLDFTDIARLSMHHAQPVFLEFVDGKVWRHIGGEWKLRRSQVEALD